MNSNESKIMVAVDRFEGDDKVYAVLELPDLDHAIIPASFLPQNTFEGDWLELTFKLAPEKRDEMEKEIMDLQKKMI